MQTDAGIKGRRGHCYMQLSHFNFYLDNGELIVCCVTNKLVLYHALGLWY